MLTLRKKKCGLSFRRSYFIFHLSAAGNSVPHNIGKPRAFKPPRRAKLFQKCRNFILRCVFIIQLKFRR